MEKMAVLFSLMLVELIQGSGLLAAEKGGKAQGVFEQNEVSGAFARAEGKASLEIERAPAQLARAVRFLIPDSPKEQERGDSEDDEHSDAFCLSWAVCVRYLGQMKTSTVPQGMRTTLSSPVGGRVSARRLTSSKNDSPRGGGATGESPAPLLDRLTAVYPPRIDSWEAICRDLGIPSQERDKK